MRKTTIQDIAKELGLSRNTVSKALMGSDSVAEETKFMVLRKAYEMGYAKFKMPLPKEVSEMYRKNSTQNVLVLGRDSSSFWHRIITGISEELSRNNCRLFLNFIDEAMEDRMELPRDLTEGGVDGVIVLNVFSEDYIRLIAKQGMPIVFLDAPKHCAPYLQYGDVVAPEGEHSVRKLVENVIGQGMRRIGFIGDITYCKTIYDRYRGFASALIEANLERDRSIIKTDHVEHRYYDRSEVEAAFNSMPYIPDAIVCANDDIAKDLYYVLKEKNISIPKDVAVIGFDDKEEAEIMSPPLSTVHIPNKDLGIRLVQELFWRIENPERTKELVLITTDIVLRDSSVKSRALN